MAREHGLVVTYSRGYGFVTTGSDIKDAEAPRYFFHASQVSGNVSALRPGIPVTFDISASDRADGKSLAVNIRDENEGPIVFTRSLNVNMSVSGPNRRVAIAERLGKDDATFGFAVDQENGERVFVPMPLMRGQQIEYTMEPSDKGPKAVNITGPMGSPLQRPNANRGGMGGNFGMGGGGRGGAFNGAAAGGFQQQGGFRGGARGGFNGGAAGGRGGFVPRGNNNRGGFGQPFNGQQQQPQQQFAQNGPVGGAPMMMMPQQQQFAM